MEKAKLISLMLDERIFCWHLIINELHHSLHYTGLPFYVQYLRWHDCNEGSRRTSSNREAAFLVILTSSGIALYLAGTTVDCVV